MRSDIIRITTMTASRAEAQRIADTLTHSRHAACVQVEGPVTSTFWWNNTREKTEEWRCLITTTDTLFDTVEAEIRHIHTYDEPEILAYTLTRVPPSFAAWVRKEITSVG